ncbi:MAG: AMP-binding protein [Acidimicrobiales bacterium]
MTTTFIELLAGSSSTVTLPDGATTSASELADRGRRISTGLQASGVNRGDRVAAWLDNGLAYLDLLAACAAGGFVLVNVNTRYNPVEAATLIGRSGATLVVTARGQELNVDVPTVSPLQLTAMTASPPDTYAVSDADPFLVFTTSGTTSKPKMVLHRQRSIVQHSFAVATAFRLSADTPAYVALPLCGVFGLNSFAAAVVANSPLWLSAGFDAQTAAGLVEAESIVAMNGTDDMFHRMLATDANLTSLRICGYGAFNASLDDLVDRAAVRGATLSGLYGMSEVQALLAFRDPSAPVTARKAAGGRLSSAASAVRAIDPSTGAVCEPGVEGELQIRGASLFAGYLAEGGASIDDDLTSRATHDGWFGTGDLGFVEDDRTFTFLSRMGDVLRLGGFLVAPAEIEEAVLSHPGIADVQVVAATGPQGARPVAFVIVDPASGIASIDEHAVIATCAAVLARFKCPVRVIEVSEFPTTDGPNGRKIQKARLRDLAQAALEDA